MILRFCVHTGFRHQLIGRQWMWLQFVLLLANSGYHRKPLTLSTRTWLD